jgi:hypothetical protein
MPCPNPIIGMGSKDANGNFSIAVSALIAGHYIYVSDACSDPPLRVGMAQLVTMLETVPLLPRGSLILAVTLLGLVGFFGLIRRAAAGRESDR